MPLPLRALRYYGGKSPAGPVPVGQWVASRLLRRQCYVEPFCGMAGVLLQRPKSPVEVLNDKSRFLMNWWRCVRDRADEFAALTENTPGSKAEFEDALEHICTFEPIEPGLMEAPNLRLGLAWHIVITQSVMHADGGSPHWACNYIHPTTGGRRPNIRALAERMKDVFLHCVDALDIVKRVADLGDAMVYLDPPYPGSDTEHYRAGGEIDIAAFGEALKALRVHVAVSGYGDTWDFLGWNREEFRRTYMASGRHNRHNEKKVSERTEVLWMNYDPPTRLF